jgi:hypothetical protein
VICARRCSFSSRNRRNSSAWFAVTRANSLRSQWFSSVSVNGGGLVCISDVEVVIGEDNDDKDAGDGLLRPNEKPRMDLGDVSGEERNEASFLVPAAGVVLGRSSATATNNK